MRIIRTPKQYILPNMYVCYRCGCFELIGEEKKMDGEKGRSFPQDTEKNEYRFIDAGWMDQVAYGLTAGDKKHPGETWRGIPAEEHIARAIRHLNMYRMGDRSDKHLINAYMRCMMAFCMDQQKDGESK